MHSNAPPDRTTTQDFDEDAALFADWQKQQLEDLIYDSLRHFLWNRGRPLPKSQDPRRRRKATYTSYGAFFY